MAPKRHYLLVSETSNINQKDKEAFDLIDYYLMFFENRVPALFLKYQKVSNSIPPSVRKFANELFSKYV